MQSIYTSLGLLVVLASLSNAVRSDGFLVPKQPKFACSADGFFPVSSGACAKQYYLCQSGNAYLKNCPNDTIFDESTKQCKSSDAVNCRAGPCLTPNGYYPMPDPYCGPDHYNCVDGVPTIIQCPSGTGYIFDPVSRGCKPASLFDQNIPDCFSCQAIAGDFPVRYPICSYMHHRCFEGLPYKYTCPGNTIFDPTTKQCGPVGTVTCWGKCDPAKNENFTIADKCSSDYIACVGGIPSIKTCPEGNFFDSDSRNCKLVAEVNCVKDCSAGGLKPIPDVPCTNQYIDCSSGSASLATCDVQNPIFDGTSCRPLDGSCWTCASQAAGVDGFYPIVPGRCHPNFVECVSNKAYIKNCTAPGAVFDPINKICTEKCPSQALAYWSLSG